MPLNNKPIHEWNSILIDTGIILSLFAAQNGSTNIDVLFVQKLIKFLCRNKTQKGDRTIYISTITLSELLTKENDAEKIDSNKLHAIAHDLGFKTNEYAMGRQWIYADYMIGMTAFANKLDAIITLDKKTFYPVCKDFIGTDCVLAYKELFEATDNFILKYDYANVDNFVGNKPFAHPLNTKSTNPVQVVHKQQTDIFGNQLP